MTVALLMHGTLAFLRRACVCGTTHSCTVPRLTLVDGHGVQRVAAHCVKQERLCVGSGVADARRRDVLRDEMRASIQQAGGGEAEVAAGRGVGRIGLHTNLPLTALPTATLLHSSSCNQLLGDQSCNGSVHRTSQSVPDSVHTSGAQTDKQGPPKTRTL